MGPFGRLVALGTVATLALLAALSVSLLAPDNGVGKAGLPQPTELCDATGIEGCQPVKHFDAKSLYKDDAAIDQGHPNRIDFYGQLFQSVPAGTDTTLQKVRLRVSRRHCRVQRATGASPRDADTACHSSPSRRFSRSRSSFESWLRSSPSSPRSWITRCGPRCRFSPANPGAWASVGPAATEVHQASWERQVRRGVQAFRAVRVSQVCLFFRTLHVTLCLCSAYSRTAASLRHEQNCDKNRARLIAITRLASFAPFPRTGFFARGR